SRRPWRSTARSAPRPTSAAASRCAPLRRNALRPDLRKLDDRRRREAHVLDADPLALAVRLLAAGEDVRRRQPLLRQSRAVGAAADRRLARLEPGPADRLLERADDLGTLLQGVAHVAVGDRRLDLDRRARVETGDLGRDVAEE